MEAQTKTVENQAVSRALVEKAFFGKDNCLSVQVRDKSIYFKWGTKQASAWNWKTVKFSDIEAGTIIRVLKGLDDEAKFFHSFQDDKTQIWIKRANDAVIFKVEKHTKGLNKGEQQVLEVLLTNSIWLTNMVL